MREPIGVVPAYRELELVSQYLDPRWEGLEGLSAGIVRKIHQRAAQLGRGLIEEEPVVGALYALHKRRSVQFQQSLSGRSLKLAPRYDSLCRQLDRMGQGVGGFRLAICGLAGKGGPGIEIEAARLTRSLEGLYPGLCDSRPRGWPEIAGQGDDLSGMREWANIRRAEEASFEGHDFRPGGGLTFASKVSPAHILHASSQRGLSPLAALTEAILTHCLGMVCHNNTLRMIREIEGCALGHPPISFVESYRWANPFLQALDRGSKKLALQTPSPESFRKEDFWRAVAAPKTKALGLARSQALADIGRALSEDPDARQRNLACYRQSWIDAIARAGPAFMAEQQEESVASP